MSGRERAGQPTRQRVYREDTEDGVLRPVPIVETEDWPTAAEVVAALRDFVAQAADGDLVLLRPAQVRVLVERIDETAQAMRNFANRLSPTP